jgi:site-specific DNA-methyltransferase (adenine-specific)
MYKIKLGDCLELMNEIKDKSIDLIICDLPYGETSNNQDITLSFDKLWKQYERIIKDRGNIVLFAQGFFYIDLVNSNRKLFKYDLIWDKVLTSGFLNAKRRPLRQHEQIAIFYKKLGTYNPQFTVGKPQHSQGTKYLIDGKKNNNYNEFNLPDDSRAGETLKYPKSILTFQKPHSSVALHRTEKSIECLEWLIKTYSNENDLILDNTMGSGTSIIAAQNTNRNSIGFEIDEKYFEISKNRIEENERKRNN